MKLLTLNFELEVATDHVLAEVFAILVAEFLWNLTFIPSVVAHQIILEHGIGSLREKVETK